MKSFWQHLPRPILVLAPMAGYTESPFRRLVREIEPSTVLVSELLSCEAFRHKSEKTLRMASFTPLEKKYYCVQLFGSQVDSFLFAVKVVEELGADGIDLNLGCPSPKVIGSGHGSALLKDPHSTARLIEKIVQSTSLPVSVKMRLGFYDDEGLLQTARDFESAGISALAIHGRTTKQRFSGKADWDKIYQVKDTLSHIPVIGNGDVTSASLAHQKLRHLDGIMIGRGALKNPWIFRECRALFKGEKLPPKPSLKEKLDLFDRHARLSVEFKDERWAMIEMRKHFAQMIRGIPRASKFRDRLIRVESYAEMKQIFEEILNS